MITIIFLLFASDTTIKIPLSEVHYILPCTWKCSCDWSKVHTGWSVEWKGKIYNVEGERRDEGKVSDMFRNQNK